MKACVGVEAQLHQFLNSALDEASSQVQASAPLTTEKDLLVPIE